jgi:hypothetical protein
MCGDPICAAELASAAAATGDEIGAPIEAARSRILVGRALAQAGHADRAAAELQRAAAELEAAARCGTATLPNANSGTTSTAGRDRARPTRRDPTP